MRRAGLVLLVLAVLTAAGCGGSSGEPKAEKQVTVPAYGAFHATTVEVTTGSPALCRGDAEALTRDAVVFLVPSATPVDMYFVAARAQYYDFRAHGCDLSILQTALARRLDREQREELVARIPFLPASLAR